MRLKAPSPRLWIIASLTLALVLVLGANAHFLYLAVTSQPGCVETTMAIGSDGQRQVLEAAKGGC